jgi:hypothetical protein
MRAEISKFLMLIGAIIFAVGFMVMLAPKIPWLGRLPGDIDFKGKNFRVYFPIVTCIILSILLTILLNLINIFRR